MWNPWRALRDRRDTLFELAELPDKVGGAVVFSDADGAVIIIDRDMRRTERRVALAHELVHLERGGVEHHPDNSPMWSPVVAREENRVDRIVAERLIPRDALVVWLTARDQPATALDVAEEFDVTEPVAMLALLDLVDLG